MANTVIIILAGVSLIALCILMVICLSMYSEYRSYNKGKCADCGNDLRYCYKDLYGDRTYICDKCKNIVTLTWKFIDKKARKSK